MNFLSSTLGSLTGVTSASPFVILERIDLPEYPSIWVISQATRRSDGIKCTVFEFDARLPANRGRLPLARNMAKKLKTLRFPGVVKIIDVVETDTSLIVATERVTPLYRLLEDKTLKSESITWGLYSIVSCLKLINIEASSIHGNINVTSVFITESGDWKIGGFEVLTNTKDPSDSCVYTYGGLVPGNTNAPPEVAKSGWQILQNTQPINACDSWQLGALIANIFNILGKPVPTKLLANQRKLVANNPRLRPSFQQLLEQGRVPGGFFNTAAIEVTESLASITIFLQQADQRERFLHLLESAKSELPSSFIEREILPELIKSLEYGEGGSEVLATTLDIGQEMTDEAYKASLVPTIVKMYASPNRGIRIKLLESLPSYINNIDKRLLNDKVFVNLVSGFSDTEPALREMTVRSIIHLVHMLNDRNLNNDLLRYLAKTQNDPEPGIRTNTTICLGKISQYLSSGTRTGVLTTAFARALKDPFVYSRLAALKALSANAEIFSPQDCASKLVSAILPSIIDKDKTVREEAKACFSIYMERIEEYASTLPDSTEVTDLTQEPVAMDTTETINSKNTKSNTSENVFGYWGGSGDTDDAVVVPARPSAVIGGEIDRFPTPASIPSMAPSGTVTPARQSPLNDSNTRLSSLSLNNERAAGNAKTHTSTEVIPPAGDDEWGAGWGDDEELVIDSDDDSKTTDAFVDQPSFPVVTKPELKRFGSTKPPVVSRASSTISASSANSGNKKLGSLNLKGGKSVQRKKLELSAVDVQADDGWGDSW
ncbi:ARM repeat-containing protein [Nadsonia fulvescens var. elongata DSM 6958]|uniref:ARM repeat-containing protein n=1 Tax=Nadsonia fulvescens var. elongata DSM 6958 TaxID=857566 RepID=A0A1E3PK92_9ASCO|nr:ARM repeat-containing protein [Nadsonia fulvescens var. elongata DSM 6958]